MRRTAISVFTLACVLASAACGSAGDDSSSEKPSSAAAPSGSGDAPGQPAGQGECTGQTWPQAIPDFRGTALGETVVGAGLCFGIGAVTSVDGRDVMNDPASHTIPWTITDQSPAPGTSVTAETPVTLTVDAPH